MFPSIRRVLNACTKRSGPDGTFYRPKPRFHDHCAGSGTIRFSGSGRSPLRGSRSLRLPDCESVGGQSRGGRRPGDHRDRSRLGSARSGRHRADRRRHGNDRQWPSRFRMADAQGESRRSHPDPQGFAGLPGLPGGYGGHRCPPGDGQPLDLRKGENRRYRRTRIDQGRYPAPGRGRSTQSPPQTSRQVDSAICARNHAPGHSRSAGRVLPGRPW